MRSKNLHYVQHTVDITQGDDPDANWAEGIIQVDKVLSEELGRTIRNGNQFRLVGYGANLKGFAGSDDLDIGFAGTAAVQFCPVTKNSVAAHQGLYRQWLKQKSLSGTVGAYVRYDDFEVGWDGANELSPSRNSQIYTTGMGDTLEEDVVIYGSSASGGYVSLETYYNNLNPIALTSRTAFGSIIKTAKFEDVFPGQRTLIMPTSFTSQTETSTLPDNYHGGIANGDITWLPSGNHLSHMTGTLFFYFKGVSYHAATIPPTNPDELRMTITLVYEGWSSLAPTPNKRLTNKSAAKTLRGKK